MSGLNDIGVYWCEDLMVSGFNDIGVYWCEYLMVSLCDGDQIKREDEKSVGRWQIRGKTREQGEDDRLRGR